MGYCRRNRSVWKLAVCAAITLCALVAGCGSFPCIVRGSLPFTAVITIDTDQPTLSSGETTAFLRTVALGGHAPYSYSWRVVDPAGQEATHLLRFDKGVSAEFVAGALHGPYEIFCEVVDRCGTRVVGRKIVQVGSDLGLEVSAVRSGTTSTGIDLGRTVVNLPPTLVTPPFEIRWKASTPDGIVTVDLLDVPASPSPTFTGAGPFGTYLLTANIFDADGASFSKHALVTVSRMARLDVGVDRQFVNVGGGTTGRAQLFATVIGGDPPFQYQWEVVGQTGSTRSDLLWDASIETPIFESDHDVGRYRVRCAVTDANKRVFVASTTIETTPRLALDLTIDRAILSSDTAGGETEVRATTTGGLAPISYSWTAFDPDGNTATALITSNDGNTAVFRAGALPGQYIVRCTATSALGTTATNSVTVIVEGKLGVTVRSHRDSIPLLAPSHLRSVPVRAYIYGGSPPYRSTWFIIQPPRFGGSYVLASSSTRQMTFTARRESGVYTVVCRATDASGKTALDQQTIHVGKALAVKVLTDRLAIAPNGGVAGQVQLGASVGGGAKAYEYGWQVVDPNGNPANGLLTTTSEPSTVFTSTDIEGVYSVTLTVIDVIESVVSETVEIVVGNANGSGIRSGFSIDVSARKQALSPSGDTTTLTAITTGGVEPVTFEWSVLNPLDEDDNGRLDSTDSQTVVFTSGSLQGTFRVRCKATDLVGNSFTDSVQITVSNEFNLDVSANVTHVAPGKSVELLADRSGGEPNFTYRWSAIDQTGTLGGTFETGASSPGNATQADSNDAINRWTAPSLASRITGPYRISVVATDAVGNTFTDSIVINVSNAFLAELSASRQQIGPGEAVTLLADRTGGAANFTYSWTATDSGGAQAGAFTTGSTGPGSATQIATDDASNTWTAPPAGAGVLGTYHLSVTVTDASGNSFSDGVNVKVTDPFSINLVTATPLIASGGSPTIIADRNGGVALYTYSWTATDSSGVLVGNFTTGATGTGTAQQASVPDDATITWTSPAVVPGAPETFTITCVAADAFGSTFTDAIQFVRGTSDAMSQNLTANAAYIRPSQPVSLSTTFTGGVPPMDVSWSVTNEAGASAGVLLEATQLNKTGGSTNTWTAPAAALGVLGTYRVVAVVTDAGGNSFTDVVHVIVRDPFSVDLSASSTYIGPGNLIRLLATKQGGEGTYTYNWSAKNDAGTLIGTFTTGATGTGTALLAGVAGDGSNMWVVTAEGSYTVTVLGTDNRGDTFSDSLSIVVTSQEIFSLDVTADRRVVAPGETVNLAGDRTGGIPNFQYVWIAVNEAGATAGTLGAATQVGVVNDTTNTWVAPTGTSVSGTYRITGVLTDVSGRSFTDSVIVEVSTLALQNIFLAPPAANLAGVLIATNLSAAPGGADPGQQISAGLTNPTHPRSVQILITDADNSITGGTARVAGISAEGLAQSEVITIAASAGGSSTNVGVVPFATVTRIDLFTFTGVDAFLDTVSIGVGNKFGLTGPIEAATDVLYINEAGTVRTSGFTVDATVNQQGVTFNVGPNGANNYVVVFRAR